MSLFETTSHRYGIILLCALLFVVVIQALREPEVPKREVVKKDTMCKGEPIFVDYPYSGEFLDPWECKVQCDDGIQRYIYYSNGLATQCQDLPGCNDWGEDHGETCTAVSTTQVDAELRGLVE